MYTPHIGKLDLYRTSCHFPYSRDSQYPPMITAEQLGTLAREGVGCAELANRIERGDLDGYLLKPMNCPHHMKIYSSSPHSYRDLPVRLAEFGTVYRWEQSGEIGGLTRVRGLTQDDAHLFCTEDQLGPELVLRTTRTCSAPRTSSARSCWGASPSSRSSAAPSA